MPSPCAVLRSRVISPALVLLAFLPAGAVAQHWSTSPKVAPAESVTVTAGTRYEAGALHRFLFGGAYRDVWLTPIRVPVLDLHSFAGGLRPEKEGGGQQTKSLHLVGADGINYVFRSVDKDHVVVPERWRGTVVQSLALDGVSNSYPAASLVAARILDAAGVLHVTPTYYVMPDDPALGKFRSTFAGRLGGLEVDPAKGKHGHPGFAGAANIIDSDSLLARIDRSADQPVDARAFLKARLTDMLLNDWDRGPSQWKWAQFGSGAGSPWEPIPRDRDKALISSTGFLPGLARPSSSMLVAFTAAYPPMQKLTVNSVSLDRRLLGGLQRPVWDSIARSLQASITDSVIDAAVAAVPPEYQSTAPELVRVLRARRDSLPEAAARFYLYLAEVVDVHGTDAADRAVVTRRDNDHVAVRLQSGNGEPYFDRVFDARETREIRLYLHGGNDHAVVVGDVAHSIPVRIIGGDGNNTLIDSSRVGGQGHAAHLYEAGHVTGVSYGPDTLFDRRPQMEAPAGLTDPIRDFGSRAGPTAGLSINHDVGIMPRVGFTHYGYAFDHYPYSSMIALEGRYSIKRDRYKVQVATDNRLENSDWHFTSLTRMSQLEVIEFHGLGNSTPAATPDSAYFNVSQRQWLFRPAVALSLSGTTELSFGPVLQYSVTGNVPGTFVHDSQPYGFGRTGSFGEASLRLGLHHDNRFPPRHAHEGTVFDVGASYFPALWDVTRGFEEVDASGGLYFTLPVPTHPYLALRGGGKKLWGDFPFQDAAFLGGSTTIRTLDPQRYAGDASVYGTAELRIPVLKVHILAPIDVGLLGTVDYGRVYLDGVSDGGWHNAYGGGFWFGFHDLTADIRVMRAVDVGRTAVLTLRAGFPGGPFR